MESSCGFVATSLYFFDLNLTKIMRSQYLRDHHTRHSTIQDPRFLSKKTLNRSSKSFGSNFFLRFSMICVKVSNIRNDEKRLIKRLMGMGISENEEKNIVNDVYA